MTTRIHSSWQQAVEAKTEKTARPVDLAEPDAQAAELAETLKKTQTQFLFTRIVLFTVKWVLRPLFWLPIKYYGILMYRCLLAGGRSKANTDDDFQRRRDLEALFGNKI